MKISVITVAYNSVSTIEDTIVSVVGQTHFKDVEYIVVDGGSTDGTADIIKRHGDKIAKWVSETDGGIYDAMNKGISMATGDVIGVLNSDDVYAGEGVLERIAAALASPEVDSCYSDLVYVDGSMAKIKRRWKSGEFTAGRFREGWHPPHPTFFVKKELYSRYGPFDTRYKISADYEIMLRFLERFKASVRYIPQVTVKMRVGGASNRSLYNIAKANMEVRRAWINNGLTPPPFIFLKKPLSKLKQLGLHGPI